MNSHQQQLLQILQIKPVQLHADFSRFQPFNEAEQLVSPTVSNLTISDTNTSADIVFSHQVPAEFAALAADVQRALQLYLPEFTWRRSAQLQQCELLSAEMKSAAMNSPEIHTPDLVSLANPGLKQQLWQLMSQYAGDNEKN
jgi:hypothetical protein